MVFIIFVVVHIGFSYTLETTVVVVVVFVVVAVVDIVLLCCYGPACCY